MSWDEAFADRYEEWSADMTADVAFYVELARQAAGPLVEMAIGSGRIAIPVAQATGQRVIGVDSSPAMLSQAWVRAAAAGVQLDVEANGSSGYQCERQTSGRRGCMGVDVKRRRKGPRRQP